MAQASYPWQANSNIDSVPPFAPAAPTSPSSTGSSKKSKKRQRDTSSANALEHEPTRKQKPPKVHPLDDLGPVPARYRPSPMPLPPGYHPSNTPLSPVYHQSSSPFFQNHDPSATPLPPEYYQVGGPPPPSYRQSGPPGPSDHRQSSAPLPPNVSWAPVEVRNTIISFYCSIVRSATHTSDMFDLCLTLKDLGLFVKILANIGLSLRSLV